MEFNRRPVASLWIGKRLHYVNQLCLKSHLVQGHPVILYCTDEIENLPEGIETRPASEIMDLNSDRISETSPSFWSNVFRYKMIQKTGAIWIDCDAFCHRPFPEDQEWILAGHGMRGALNCGVVGLPQEGPLMEALLDYYDNLPVYPPWWNRKQRDKMDALSTKLPLATRIYKAERTAFGPQAFTYFVKKTGNMDRAMPSSALYPVPFQLVDVFFDPYGSVEGWLRDDTLSVHLYTNAIKPYWQKNAPLPNSYVARMCEQVGIDPAESLRGGACDIEPRTANVQVAAPAGSVSSAALQAAEQRVSELTKAMNLQARKAQRKVLNVKADSILIGVCAMLQPGDLAIDLGANVGDVSAKLLETGAEVIAFDPEPWAAQKIQARLGQEPNFTFHAAAVGVTEGTARLYRSANFENNKKSASVKSTTLVGGRTIADGDGDGMDITQIDFIAFLKDLIAKRGRIAFLKMDIEGAELDLLEKMDAENLFDHIQFTVAETHAHKFRQLAPRYQELSEKFAARYKPNHVNLD